MGASARTLIKISWRDEAESVSRLFLGSALFVDGDGDVWGGAGELSGLDNLDHAISGEAAGLNFTLSGVPSELADRAWLSFTNEEIVGSEVKVYEQRCHVVTDQPVGDMETLWTGTIDDIMFDDRATDEGVVSSIMVEVTSRFSVRRVRSGLTLSDVDQRARSAVINPGANPDRFCERAPLLRQRTVRWPQWAS